MNRTLLYLALCALALSGCETNKNKNSMFHGRTVRFEEKTLGDLEDVKVNIKKEKLKPVPVEQVLDSYRNALNLFSTPDERQKALRRMADLTMVASEDRTLSGIDEPKVSAHEAPSVNTAVAPTAQEKINYKNAIDLYEKVIADAPPNTNLAQEYYLLSKAYDMNGMPEQSLKTLNVLVQKYPNTPFQAEAQFRRGELLFNQGNFDGAEKAYTEVVKAGEKSGYFEQAKYKEGWCQFKQSDYDHAVVTFTQLLDHFQAKKTTTEQSTKTLEKIRDDTLRVTSMAFSYLDGPNSLASHFQKSGPKGYEVDLYKSLAGLYVTQERYLDSASTYETFVKTHPFHPEDPAFSTALIDTYIKGNYPSKVLPAKQEFVEQYGIKSEFWKKVTPEQRNAYMSSLKQHIVELAQYHHAKGQQSNSPDDFNQASRWYREFLETFPKDENVPVMNELLAESLFSAKQFQPAIQEFEHTGYDYKHYPEASKAGYFALLAYQEVLKPIPAGDPSKKEWVKKKTQSSFKFVDAFPTDKRCPDILNNVLDDQLATQDLEGVIQTSDKLVKLNPPASTSTQQRAWQVRSDAEFDLKHYKDAETSYGKLLVFAGLSGDERRTAQERQAASIYKQAEALRDGGKPQEASKEFLRVGQVQPNASIKPNADYDAAALMLAAKDYPNAIKVLENFRKQYPTHELAAGIPEKLTVAYQQLGSLSNAAGELEKVAKQRSTKDPSFSRDAIWQAADMQESSSQHGEAIRLYEQYVKEYPVPLDRNVEAQNKLIMLYKGQKNTERALFWIVQLADNVTKAGAQATPRMRYLGAQASFTLAEPQFARFQSIKLTQPLKATLSAKRSAMDDALKAYKRTADFAVAEYTTAANHQIGELYRILADDLLHSERPAGLSDEAKEEYELVLEEQATPFEDQATSFFETNTHRTKDNIYDEWVRKSFDSLSKLQPGRYAKAERVEDSIDVIY